jgi:prepilin-type N-terminal cleavage/methylation domain-containing protein
MKKLLRDERGLTLVEILAALALSGLIITLASSIMITSALAVKRIDADTKLRNEANYISEAVEINLKNISEAVDPQPSATNFTSFTLKEFIGNASGNPTIHTFNVAIQSGALLIDGNKINGDTYTVSGFFELVNNQVKVSLTVTDPSINKSMYIFNNLLLHQ